jgi:hypothetical protein
LNEPVAVQRIRVQAVPGAQTSGVADVFWRTEKFALGCDAQDEEGQREEHCVVMVGKMNCRGKSALLRIRSWSESRVCSVLKKLSIVRVVCVFLDFQEDSASASSAPLA